MFGKSKERDEAAFRAMIKDSREREAQQRQQMEEDLNDLSPEQLKDIALDNIFEAKKVESYGITIFEAQAAKHYAKAAAMTNLAILATLREIE